LSAACQDHNHPQWVPSIDNKGQTSLCLFATIATLGTPQNVTVQEMRIEGFFAAETDTVQIFKDWAAKALR
jgi:hypothetical protein